jgi:hypothetical protein
MLHVKDHQSDLNGFGWITNCSTSVLGLNLHGVPTVRIIGARVQHFHAKFLSTATAHFAVTWVPITSSSQAGRCAAGASR